MPKTKRVEAKHTAFPLVIAIDEAGDPQEWHEGLDTLTYIATAALQGMLSGNSAASAEKAAKRAVAYAEALIAELP